MKLNPYFGRFGGQFVPEILIPALDQLEEAFIAAKMIRHSNRNFTRFSLTMPVVRRL
mgnify:CR=1 FL=1